MTEKLALFWLSQALVSGKKFLYLKNKYTAVELFDGIRYNDSQITSLFGEITAKKLKSLCNEEKLNETYDKMTYDGIRYMSCYDEEFPKSLLNDEVITPVGLYYKGDVKLLNSVTVAVVGTRAVTPYGKEVTKKISRELAQEGICIASGLADGVDGIAHETCLETNGKTIAVLGGGLKKPSPESNVKLFDKVCEKGLAISEYPPDFPPAPYTFPERNRIVSGISKAVIITEAPLKSGALITAECAIKQGKELFCIPANVTSRRSEGSNALLYSLKAKPVSSASDVMRALGLRSKNKKTEKRYIQLDIFGQKLYNVLQNGETFFDNIVVKLQHPPHEVASKLSQLEIIGAIINKAPNVYEINPDVEIKENN